MAEDHYTTEYHLTPIGWISGTQKVFGKGDPKARPGNAVETWEEECYQRSMWSKEVWTKRLIWHDEATPEAERERLRKQFRSPFTDSN